MQTPNNYEIDNSQGSELSKAVHRTITYNGNSKKGANGWDTLELNGSGIKLHHSSTEGVYIEILSLNGNSDYLYIIKTSLSGGITIEKYAQTNQPDEDRALNPDDDNDGETLDPDSEEYDDVKKFIDELLEAEKIKD